MSFFKDHPTHHKILLLLGHPDSGQTHCGELALLYETSAKAAGHEVKRFNLGDMRFDPTLHQGYKVIQDLEPDLKTFHDALKWCDHFVLIYPNWWSTMPAPLKGLFDRAWLPGICFHVRRHTDGTQKMLWDKLMKGKTARVIVLSGSHPFLIWLFIGDYTNEIARGILWYAGFKVRLARFGPSEKAPEWKWNDWRRKVTRWGRLGE